MIGRHFFGVASYHLWTDRNDLVFNNRTDMVYNLCHQVLAMTKVISNDFWSSFDDEPQKERGGHLLDPSSNIICQN